MPDEFYGDETLITSHKITSFSILATSAKLAIFNIMKFYIKPPFKTGLKLTLQPHNDMAGRKKATVPMHRVVHQKIPLHHRLMQQDAVDTHTCARRRLTVQRSWLSGDTARACHSSKLGIDEKHAYRSGRGTHSYSRSPCTRAACIACACAWHSASQTIARRTRQQ